MKRLLLIAFCIVTFVACRKDTTNFDGASIEEQYSDFSIVEPFATNKDSVAFASSETVQFSARFNKTVNWKISIVGQTSKAKKTITGLSKSIDASNAIWNGSTSQFPMFKEEKCFAKLTIESVNDSFQVVVNVKSIKVNNGLVIADFENGFNTAWTKFVQSGANMDFAVKTDTLAPQGAKYLKMAGTVNWDYLIGLIDFPASAYGAPTLALPSNPDDVYFNCLIYGVPSTNESLVLFQIKEDENANGSFNASNEDEYDLQVTVNWEGWKLVSFKYSDIPCLINGQPSIPKGNSQHNPDKIWKISMLHLANPANGFASCKLDYIIFTNNAPLEP